MQPDHLQPRIGDQAPDPPALRRRQAVGLGTQGEGRELHPVIAKPRREIDLPLERQLSKYLVAQRYPHPSPPIYTPFRGMRFSQLFAKKGLPPSDALSEASMRNSVSVQLSADTASTNVSQP
jgi:hypothetical protein